MNELKILDLIFFSLATSAVSLTISKANIFAFLRKVAMRINKWLGELLSCPYCTSHWVSFCLVAIYRPTVASSGILIADLAVSAFSIVAVSSMFSWVIYRAYKGLDLPELIEENDEEVEMLRNALVGAKKKLLEQKDQIAELSKQVQ